MTDITHEHSLDEAQSSVLEAISVKTENGCFFVKPHIQLGRCERRLRSLSVAFHVFPSKSKWRVDFKRSDKKKWHDAEVLIKSDFKIVGSVDSVRYLVKLDDLSAGCVYDYRIWRDDEVVFTSSALAPKKAAQPFRFVVYGDVAMVQRKPHQWLIRCMQLIQTWWCSPVISSTKTAE
jgi:hypothetical protein